MSDPLQEQLLGHLLGALDPAEEEQVAARLRTDPELRREFARVREWLEPLEAGRYDFDPPAGLAERTCRVVALQVESPAADHSDHASGPTFGRCPARAGPTKRGCPGRRPMSPVAAPPDAAGRFRWVDVAAAAGFFAAASLLLMPAIQSSRFNAQLIACQDNLRQIGVGMIQYSQHHNGYFPTIPTRGRLAVAGIYAPILVHDGLVTDSRRFVCPGSSLAGRTGLRVPSFDELQTASQDKLDGLIRWMGGSYGYHLGYMRDGVYQGTKNLGRTGFALAADMPGSDPSNGRQSLNHGGRGENVLFEYGGARFVTSPQPFPEADDIFANDWDLVAAGLHPNDAVIAPSAARPILIPISQ